MALTDIKVRIVKPTDKQYNLTDGNGMHFLVHPNGSKYWRLQYHFGGKQKMCLVPDFDGLKGFPEAINTVYPQKRVQLCIVYMIRNNLRYVFWKYAKELVKDLKQIYQFPDRKSLSAGIGALL